MPLFYAYIANIGDEETFRWQAVFASRAVADEWWRALSASPHARFIKRVAPGVYAQDATQRNLSDLFDIPELKPIAEMFRGRVQFADLNDGAVPTLPPQEVTNHISGGWYHIRSISNHALCWHYDAAENRIRASGDEPTPFRISIRNGVPEETIMASKDRITLYISSHLHVDIGQSGQLQARAGSPVDFKFHQLESGDFAMFEDASVVFVDAADSTLRLMSWELFPAPSPTQHETTIEPSDAENTTLVVVIEYREYEYGKVLDSEYFAAIATLPNILYLDLSVLSDDLHPCLRIMETVPSLIAIRVDEIRHPDHDQFFEALAADSPLHTLVQFKDDLTGIINKYRDNRLRYEADFIHDASSTLDGIPASKPAVGRLSPPPLVCTRIQGALPDDQDKIIANIVYFVSSTSHLSKLCFVSKKFKALVTPSLYRSLDFDHPKNIVLYAERITGQPNLGSYLEDLSHSIALVHGADALVQLAGIFVHTTNLKSFQAPPTDLHRNSSPSPWAVFTSLAQHTGRTLEKLEVFVLLGGVEPPALWTSFEKLKDLTWRWGDPFQHEVVVPHDAMPLLEKLTLRQYDPSFVRVLIQMNLPSLTTIVDLTDGNDALLKHHGPKITTLLITESTSLLVLNLCPNIRTLTILSYKDFLVCDGKISEHKASLILNHAEDHQHLAKIRFKCQMPMKGWDVVRKQWDPSSGYSALLEIQIYDIVWPENTDHAIGRNVWVKWSAQLLEDHNIKLTNSRGDAWVQRFKLTK
ncbi:hypothetical protein FIBSPDRAFT_1050195 [Athelia psychrophila]|uniref:Uncharacterized protein n=1 Tax=Athelia psychrophila TaxID=1759441 RepID=A0A166B0N9_9AGAM|nr:hypothetical protein FIBSPDRAFT_1050195 [Fibularhizoctonia sp. CBS 109695]